MCVPQSICPSSIIIFDLILLAGRLRVQLDSGFARHRTLMLRFGFHALASPPYFILNRVQFSLLFLLLHQAFPFCYGRFRGATSGRHLVISLSSLIIGSTLVGDSFSSFAAKAI